MNDAKSTQPKLTPKRNEYLDHASKVLKCMQDRLIPSLVAEIAIDELCLKEVHDAHVHNDEGCKHLDKLIEENAKLLQDEMDAHEKRIQTIMDSKAELLMHKNDCVSLIEFNTSKNAIAERQLQQKRAKLDQSVAVLNSVKILLEKIE